MRGRNANVRMTDDGYLYAVDLSMVMTGADRNYAGQVFIYLSLIRLSVLDISVLF